jgi:hypothetical protein
VRRLLILAAVLLACLLPLSAAVLTFDDVTGGGTQLPAGYGGFNWDSNFYVYDSSAYDSGYGNTYTFPSDPNAVYNAFGVLTMSVTGTPFTFDGAYFTGWAEDNSYANYTATSISIDGYLGGNLVGTVSTGLPADSFVWLGADMMVDTLVFTSSNSGNWWLMDNFTYNSAIPEPGTLLLCAAGLLLAGTLKLRRR